MDSGSYRVIIPMNEHNLTRKIIAELKATPVAWYYKTHGGGMTRAGVPDIIACYRGVFVGIEIKAEGNYPTKLQLHELEQIRSAGGVAGVVYSVEDVRELLKESVE